jgi:RNA polymerase sigma factor (sigma-70 family)
MLYPYRQPTVDETAMRVVRCLVHIAIRKGRFQRNEFEDLVQDALVHLLQKVHCFDPAKGCWSTFCGLVVRNYLSRTNRGDRHLFESMNAGNTVSANLIEEAHSLSKRFMRIRSETERIEIEEDIATAIGKLPDDLRQLCECFQEDTSVSYVAEQLGVSRGTVYRRREMVRESMVFESMAEYR